MCVNVYKESELRLIWPIYTHWKGKFFYLAVFSTVIWMCLAICPERSCNMFQKALTAPYLISSYLISQLTSYHCEIFLCLILLTWLNFQQAITRYTQLCQSTHFDVTSSKRGSLFTWRLLPPFLFTEMFFFSVFLLMNFSILF